MATSAGFGINIVAIDNASKTIEGVNKRLAAMQAPLNAVGKSLTKFGQLSGITRGFDLMRKAVHGTFQAVSRMVPALAGLTAGGIAAGLGRIVYTWSNFGQQLSITSRWLGLMPSQLHQIQNANRLMGGTADEAASAYQKLDDSLQDAVAGRNTDLLRISKFLNIDIFKSPMVAKSAQELMPAFWDAIKNQKANPAVQRKLATMLGLTPAQFKVAAAEGAAGWERLNKEAAHYGTLSDDEAGKLSKLQELFTGITIAVENFASRVAIKLSPRIADLADQFLRWMSEEDNVEKTTDKVVQIVNGLADALGFAVWIIGKLIENSGGLKTFVEILLSMWAVGKVLGGISLAADVLKLTGALKSGKAEATGLTRALEKADKKIVSAAGSAANKLAPALGQAAGAAGGILTTLGLIGLGIGTVVELAERLDKAFPSPGQEGSPWKSWEDVPLTRKWWGKKFGGWFGQGSEGGGGTGGGTPSSNVVDTSQSPQMQGLLNTISGPESGGAYDVRYTPAGGVKFTGNEHPNVAEATTGGLTSTAAGRYQMLYSTWKPIADKLGLKDFSPANQDKAAAYLASSTYQQKTGRDLTEDLKSTDPAVKQGIATALAGQWPTLPKNFQSRLGASMDALNKSNPEVKPKTADANVSGGINVTINNRNPLPGQSITADSSGGLLGAPRIVAPMVGAW